VSLTAEILERCALLGFARAGICRAEPAARPEALRAWLAAGRQGEMDYLRAWEDVLVDPAEVVRGARSIICVGDRYHDGRPDPAPAPGAGRIARYARGRDYHRVIKRRLHDLCDELRERFPGETFRACVDTAPLLEREHAARAGLGAIGKHTLLIEQGVGSYLLLGEIVTTLALEPTTSCAEQDPCGTCTRCIDACPTGAITPWSIDATRCVSYLTIEHRTLIDERLFAGIGDWLFGCDACQEVCPHNQPTERTQEAPVHDAYAERTTGFDVATVLDWTEADRREAFTQSALKRARLAMMKRNAVIVAGNMLAREDAPALRARLEAIAADESEDAVVRETARVIVGRLAR
jgi:epoxyqueuosine reductase